MSNNTNADIAPKLVDSPVGEPTDAEVAAGTRALMDTLDAEGAETARPEDWTTAVRAALVAAREVAGR